MLDSAAHNLSEPVSCVSSLITDSVALCSLTSCHMSQWPFSLRLASSVGGVLAAHAIDRFFAEKFMATASSDGSTYNEDTVFPG